jgi:hypothetical protein
MQPPAMNHNNAKFLINIKPIQSNANTLQVSKEGVQNVKVMYDKIHQKIFQGKKNPPYVKKYLKRDSFVQREG